MFDPKVDELSYQYTFTPYFEPGEINMYSMLDFKSMAANFNSKKNFVVDKQNELYIFGENIHF